MQFYNRLNSHFLLYFLTYTFSVILTLKFTPQQIWNIGLKFVQTEIIYKNIQLNMRTKTSFTYKYMYIPYIFMCDCMMTELESRKKF